MANNESISNSGDDSVEHIGSEYQIVGHDAASETGFLDLPRELQKMVYGHLPRVAIIEINQYASNAMTAQQSMSKVCSGLRNDVLDTFYAKNHFSVNMRPLRRRSEAATASFDRWITAIGDQNTARLRKLRFVSRNFRVFVSISNHKPPKLELEFKLGPQKMELAADVTQKYDCLIAACRAQDGLKDMISRIEKNVKSSGLTVNDLSTICRAVDRIQPFFCGSVGLGHKGVILSDSNIALLPSADLHIKHCGWCGRCF